MGKVKLEIEEATKWALGFANLRAELDGQQSGLKRLQEDFRKLQTIFRTQSGELGTLKSQTEAVGQSVSRLENLRDELDEMNQTVENHHL
jgi:archaellum component FlaC